METLTDTKEDIVLKNFEMETGVDLRVYRRPELIEVIADLLTFPIYAGKSVIIPFAGFLLITALLALVFLIAGFDYPTLLVAVILIPLASIINALTTASLLFLFRLRDDVTKAIVAGLNLTKEVAKDIREVYKKRDEKSLKFPGFGLIFQSVMYGVIIPIVVTVLNSKIPLIGGLFSGLIRRLADLTIGRTVKELKLGGAEVLEDGATSEEKEKWLLRQMEKIAGVSDRAGSIVSRSISWASMVLLVPLTLVFGIVLAITSGIYWLLFRGY